MPDRSFLMATPRSGRRAGTAAHSYERTFLGNFGYAIEEMRRMI